MKSSSSSRGRSAKAFGLLVAAGLVSGFLSVTASAQQPKKPAAAAPSSQPTAQPQPLSAEERQEWQRAISQVPLPKNGCFNASYPSLEWREVPCGQPSKYPFRPASGPRPYVVGNGNDIMAAITTSPSISSATGSFDSVTPGATVSGPWGSNPNVPNAFSLQINSQPFWTPACDGTANCKGWQQFIYSQNYCGGPCVFMQYWLIDYGPSCPPGPGAGGLWPWNKDNNACYFNSVTAGAPALTAALLTSMTLTGTAAAGSDKVMLTFADPTFGTITASAMQLPSVLGLAQEWSMAEFNIFGDCCSAQAKFSAGTTVVTRTQLNNGTNIPPICVAQGFTTETNNLSFGPAAPAASGAGPALIFTASIAGGSPSACAAATSIGDTHLTTFGGLLYDFQAAGDFLLAETGSGFAVQTRQVSGAPTWPNATVNKAVAVQVGKSRVAICLAPTRVDIDGKAVKLRDGVSLRLPGGGDVVRRGNVYTVRGPSGDSVRAVDNTNYIDARVGLGRWPDKVRGLLANGGQGNNSIETRDGNVLTSPFSYEALYSRFAEGWRVPANESMLSACGREVERGVPKQLFFARDLDPQLAKRTRAVCAKAGVKEGPLQDACTLDVAVIGSNGAAKVFATTPNPLVVGDAR